MALTNLKQNMLQEWREEWNNFKENSSKECNLILVGYQGCKYQIEYTIKLRIIRRQVQKYEKEIKHDRFLLAINKMIYNRIPSANALVEYYEARPELATYTIEKELERMKYIVYTHDGRELTDSTGISEYYKDQEKIVDIDLLWRCSNQSLMADIIVAMTSDEGGLIRPTLQGVISVDDVSLTINFNSATPSVKAECFFNVSIPDSKGGHLSLVGALVTVYFCPARQEFRANVNDIFPCSKLSEREIDGAANFLIELLP